MGNGRTCIAVCGQCERISLAAIRQAGGIYFREIKIAGGSYLVIASINNITDIIKIGGCQANPSAIHILELIQFNIFWMSSFGGEGNLKYIILCEYDLFGSGTCSMEYSFFCDPVQGISMNGIKAGNSRIQFGSIGTCY